MNQSNPLFIIWGKIFEIINFQGDKKEFLDRFIATVTKKTTEKILPNVPTNQQPLIKEAASHITSPEQLILYVKAYCAPQDLMRQMVSASTETFQNFLDAIRPTLSEDQVRKLFSFLESLQQQIPSQMKPLMQQATTPTQLPTRRN